MPRAESGKSKRVTAARTSSEGAKAPEQLPAKPSAGHKRLKAFLGTWRTEGQQLEGPVGPAARVTATETFEWLSGGFFLVHHFDGSVGGDDASCIEVMGYDPARESYPVHTYYNNGITNDWEYRMNGREWLLEGEWDMAGTAVRTRCAIKFNAAGDKMTGTWEYLDDAGNWESFWKVTSKKAK